MLYILSKVDLIVKDIIQTVSYKLEQNIDLTGKSVSKLSHKPNAEKGDFVIEKELNYKGIILDVESEKESSVHELHLDEIDNIFNRKIILSNESLISSVGIEDFIAKTIKDNFTESDDLLLNIPYIKIDIKSHTTINAKVDTDGGIYNFRTYLGNVKERYNINLDFEFKGSELIIAIYQSNLETLEVDATIEDIITYQEVYSVDVIAKVTVISKESGNTFDYFLLTDRTTTTDKNDPNRAKGSVEVVTCEEDVDAQQAALDAFKSNSYQHNIELTLTRDSKVFNENDFIVGRNLRIKTKDNGIYNTFISAVNKKSDSRSYVVTCGNMRITLIDRLKEVVT